MPSYDADEIRGMIAAGEVKGFTIDTNVVDSLNTNGNLDNRILLSIGNLKTKNVTTLIADIVAGEVKSHMTTAHDTAYSQLLIALKAHTKIWKADAEPIEALKAALTPRDSISDHATHLFQAFVDGIGMEVVSSDGAIETAELVTRYFSEPPPFAGSNKKHEFPDAIALAALRQWSENHGAVLAVSKDHGWTAYCEESEYLYCTDDLGKALALFHEDEEIVARCIASIAEEPGGAVATAIVDAIQRDLDDLDFELDASAFMEWDAEIEEAVVKEIEYAGQGAEQRIVSSEADSVTFLVPILAKVRVQATFDFSVHDSIDKDYVSLGGTVENVTLQHRYQITLTVTGKGGNEIEIDDAVVNSATRLRQVSFGHVEPFSEPEPDWD